MKLIIFTAAMIVITGMADPGRAAEEKSNLVVIFCDDAGYGDFSHTGHPTIDTPNISRMVNEGLNFTQFYSGSPACTASRYGLLTGRHPRRSGFSWVLTPGSKKHLHPREQTLPEIARDAGYRTAFFGKWHLGYPTEANAFTPDSLPLAHGFEKWTGLPYSNDMVKAPNPPIRLIQGLARSGAEAAPVSGYETLEISPDQSLLTELYTDRSVQFIEESKGTPFLLYLAYAMPHVPLHPGKDFVGQSARGTYGDVIEEIDASVGRILKTLKQSGIAENTLVVFTSDNGPWIIKDLLGGSSGLFRDGKGSTWEGGVRVPAVFWWPGTLQPGRRDQVASVFDIVPTFAELSGSELTKDRLRDGKSLVPAFQSPTAKLSSDVYIYGGHPINDPYALRMGKWKLHIKTYSQTGKNHGYGEVTRDNPLLFNLLEDPSETVNLAEQHTDIVQELLSEIDAFNASLETDQGKPFWE